MVHRNLLQRLTCVRHAGGAGDVALGRRAAAVPARGAEDSAAHPAALLRLQGHLGLDHTVPHLLHGHHGALQRGLQEQNQRGDFSCIRRYF